jgi:hypothetical protein
LIRTLLGFAFNISNLGICYTFYILLVCIALFCCDLLVFEKLRCINATFIFLITSILKEKEKRKQAYWLWGIGCQGF